MNYICVCICVYMYVFICLAYVYLSVLYVSTVHGHFVDLCPVKLLDISEDTDVVFNEVDGDTLAPEAAGTTDAVDVQLTTVGQIVVDDERDLLNVQTTAPHIGGDQYTTIGIC